MNKGIDTDNFRGPKTRRVGRPKESEPRTVHKRIRFTEREWDRLEREMKIVLKERVENSKKIKLDEMKPNKLATVSDLIRQLIDESLQKRRQRRIDKEPGERNRCIHCENWK